VVASLSAPCPDDPKPLLRSKKNIMDTNSADPSADDSLIVRTIVVLTIVVALTVTAAWSMLIAYWAWLLFHLVSG
jgi:hypothetical protein